MSSSGRPAGLITRAPIAGMALVVALILAACGGAGGDATLTPVFVGAVTPAPLGHRDTAYEPSRAAPALRLTNGEGRPFDLASFRGGPVFVYFGYTHCPDVCPTTLADLRAGIKLAGVAAKVVFVTVDPARDDAAAVKQYTDYYGAGYIGLTGTADEISEAAGAWGVTYQQLPSDSANGYAMAHSTDTYLVDADGMLRHHVFFGAGADVFADLLAGVAAP